MKIVASGTWNVFNGYNLLFSTTATVDFRVSPEMDLVITHRCKAPVLRRRLNIIFIASIADTAVYDQLDSRISSLF